MTKQQLIDDVILKVTQSNPSDDHEISRSQVAFWLDYFTPALMVAEIEKELDKSNAVPQLYIKVEECKTISEEDVACGGPCNDRFYVTTTSKILNLKNDAGLIALRTEEGVEIPVTSLDHIDTLRHLRFAKPSPENPVAYRAGDKIYVEGYNHSDLEFEKLSVWFVERQDITTLPDNQEIRLSEDLVPTLVDAVADKLKLLLYGSQQDVANDGIWVPTAQYHNLIRQNQENNG